jgi:hypothetical protein
MLHTVPEYFLIRDQQKEKQALKICQHRYKESISGATFFLMRDRKNKSSLATGKKIAATKIVF